jgi:hypothetical protein
MPKSIESLNSELDDVLTSHGFEVTALDSSGKEVPVPDEADLFQFHFHRGGKDYGTVTATIDSTNKMTIYYDDTIAKSGSSISEDDTGEITWFNLVKQIKQFALNHQLGFQLKDTDRLRTDMKRRDHLKNLNEGYHSVNRDTSFNDDNKTIKLVIKHNRKLDENDKRFRYIEKIFLENQQGERILVPTKKPSEARMFARHLAEGGDYKDDRWNHLKELTEDVASLGGFVRATRKREQFNESASRMILEAHEKYSQLKESIKQLQSSRGYHRYFESYVPSVITETDTALTDMFRATTVDSRIEEALATLSKFGITSKRLAEADMFQEWADNIIDEALDPRSERQVEALVKLLNDSDLAVGPNGEVAIAELGDLIEDEDLEEELRDAAEQDPNQLAAPVIISWMERQPDTIYREVLSKIDTPDEDEVAPSKNVEPVKVKPEKSTAPTPQAQQPAGDLGALPPLPPLPPLAEESDFKRLLKLSGI